jgi:hypothetical protein
MTGSAASADVSLAAPLTDIPLGAEGKTLDLQLTDTGRRAFLLGRETIVLTLRDVAGDTDSPVRINVFAGKPDADRQTSTEDPHFLGYLQLMPSGTPGHRHVATSGQFEVQQAALARSGDVLTVRLVPIIGLDQAPAGLALHIGAVALTPAAP